MLYSERSICCEDRSFYDAGRKLFDDLNLKGRLSELSIFNGYIFSDEDKYNLRTFKNHIILAEDDDNFCYLERLLNHDLSTLELRCFLRGLNGG